MNRSPFHCSHLAVWLAWCAACLAVAPVSVPAQEDFSAQEEQAVRAAVERVAPSVVRIETLGGLERIESQVLGTGPTTGLVVSPDGYILSSSFGFVGRPTSILVTLPSGSRVPATIVARDQSRMLVLLKANTEETLEVPEPAPRGEWNVGQYAIAVGRTYTPSLPNLSVGIISATDRIWGKAVQTDANVSPGNYGGPLIDIRGRVIGVLVPLSPQREGEFAGAEWYDSGIGFAVPLVDILPHLERMKQGQDLHAGRLGVTLIGTDIYALPATIASCPAKSPARLAGLRVEDTIVEIDGIPITRQSQLRHALGPRVAGDTIHVVVERAPDSSRFETTIELVAQIDPYVRPDLGLLPMRPTGTADDPRDPAGSGVVVRYVFPDSPAAQSGLRAGDRLVGINDRDIDSTETLREVVIGFDPGDSIAVRVVREDQPLTLPLVLGQSAAIVPDAPLPPPHAPLAAPPQQRPAVGVVEIRIPEAANACVAYVPENYHPLGTYGLLVWLHPPGNFQQEELIARWKNLCDEHSLILLAPQAADPRRWMPTEIEFVRRTMDEIVAGYAIDMSRVVVHGYQAGGVMAYYVALANRDIARAIAPVSGPLPPDIGNLTTDPVQPLAVYSVSAEQAPTAAPVQTGEARLRQLAFPTLGKVLSGNDRYLNEEELTELVRWIDALDRI